MPNKPKVIFQTDLSKNLCPKFDVRLFEAKDRVFEFDYQKTNMLESVRCSKKKK